MTKRLLVVTFSLMLLPIPLLSSGCNQSKATKEDIQEFKNSEGPVKNMKLVDEDEPAKP